MFGSNSLGLAARHLHRQYNQLNEGQEALLCPIERQSNFHPGSLPINQRWWHQGTHFHVDEHRQQASFQNRFHEAAVAIVHIHLFVYSTISDKSCRWCTCPLLFLVQRSKPNKILKAVPLLMKCVSSCPFLISKPLWLRGIRFCPRL